MSKFKLPTSNIASATTSRGVSVTVQSSGPVKSDGTPIAPPDITPDLLHDSDPGVAGLGQGKLMATQAASAFKNAN